MTNKMAATNGGLTYNGGTSTFSIVNGTKAYVDYTLSSSDLVEFLELILMALGHDIKYDDFVNMSSDEKKTIIRDITLSQILK